MKSLAFPLLGVVLLGAAPQAAQAPPQAPQPTFETQVELVTVDVAVVDKKGQAVRGLTRDDFVVSENGVPQTLTSFEAVVVPEVPALAGATQRRAVVSTNVLSDSRRGRSFAVLFDDIHLSPTQALRARGAVAAFLQTGVGEGDLVTLVASAGGAWWTARMPEGRDALMAILKRLDGRYVPDPSPDRITEFEAMRIEEYQDEAMAWQVKRRFDNYGAVGSEKDSRGVRPADAVTSAPGMIPEVVRMRAREVHQLASSRNRITLEVMKRVIESMADIKGRKSMILVSQGFVYDVQMKFMKDVTLASRRHNVPIYFIDTRGLQGLPEAFTAAFGRQIEVQDAVAVLADLSREAEGAEALALDTGGFVVKNSNDLSGGISRVSSESRAYYLLGYNPTDLRRDGKFRKIEVKVRPPKSKNLNVRARRGYFAPLADQVAEAKQRNSDPVIGHALDSPFEISDVPLRVSSFVFDEVSARPDERADRGRDRREGSGVQGGGRPLGGRPGVPDRGPAPRDRGVLPVRPEDRDDAPPGDPSEAGTERVPRDPGVHAAPGGVPGQGRRPRPQLGQGGLGRARVRGARRRAPCASRPRS